MTSFSPKPRSVFSAVCRSNGIVLGRTRATVGSRFPLNASLASIRFQSTPVTSFERVISGVSSLARVAWGRTVERSRTIFALRFVPAFSRIRRDIRPGLLNLVRPLVAAGKPSFLPLVQACKQASGSVTQTFRFPPIGALLSPAVHAQTMQQKDTRDHGNSYPQHG